MNKLLRNLSAFAVLLLAPLAASASAPVDTLQSEPVDTLLKAATAKTLTIDSTPKLANITVNRINSSTNNFYCQVSQTVKRKGVNSSRSQTYYSDVTNVVVTESADGIRVEFTDPQGGRQTYRFAFVDPANRQVKSYIGDRGSDIGITISRNSSTKWSVISSGICFGFGTPLNVKPSGLDLNVSMGRSTEFSYLMLLGLRVSNRVNSLSLGFGLDWQNYATRGDRYFHRSDEGRLSMEPYIEGTSHHHSQINTFSMQVPLLYQLNFGKGRNVNFCLGPILNFNTGGNIKTKYHLDGREYSVKTGKIGQRPVTLDGFCSLGYQNVAVYTRYAFIDKFRPDRGLNFNPLHVGLILLF